MLPARMQAIIGRMREVLAARAQNCKPYTIPSQRLKHAAKHLPLALTTGTVKATITKLLLWLWPLIQRIYARFGVKVRLESGSAVGTGAPPAVSGGHMHSTTSRGRVPGAHALVLAALALGSFCVPTYAQQGGQTSSVPPLTGSTAPAGGCGVGSLYVNTTTGDLYDCNAGSWNKVSGGGSGAFSGGLGTSYQDAGGISTPADPASGNARLFFNSGTSLLACITSSGANCMPSGGAGTVTQVTSGNFSPLFDVSVANQTTTPAFSFSTINQSANTVYGNCTGSTGAPAFCAITSSMLPTLSLTANGQTCTIGSNCNVNSGATAHTVALNQGNGNALTGTNSGNAGQVLISNGAGSDPSFQDPIVSYAYINLFNGASATVTQTSSVTRDSTFGQYGTLIVTWASITGSPSSCTIQIKSADSQGNLVNNGSAVSVTPANGTSGVTFTPAASLQTASQMQAVYACSTYPTAGTLTLDFAPAITTYSTQGPPGAQGSPWWVRPTDGTNNMPMGDAAARAVFEKVTDGTNGPAAVKAASTAAAAADPSFVVALSPNSPVPAGSNLVGAVNEDRGGTALVADPCQANAKSYVSINQTANAQLVTGTASKKIYPCSIHIVTATAQNIALVEGTGTTCGTGTAGVTGFGGATAATGWNFAANGGIAYGDGSFTLGAEGTAADNLCLFQSGTGQVSGGLSYVVQ
jgi:hypothetical protein